MGSTAQVVGLAPRTSTSTGATPAPRPASTPLPTLDSITASLQVSPVVWFLAPALLCILAITFDGCGTRDKLPTPPASPVTIGWINPAAGDSLAGFVDLEVEIRGTAIRAVVFLAGGIPIDTTTSAPWVGRWRCPDIESPVRVALQAVVQRHDGSAVRGREIVVWAVPNEPPRITLLRPRPTTWLERVTGSRIEAVAIDPEDGPIPPGRIHWTSTGLGRPVSGTVLPLEILREVEQRIVVEAADRWNECTRETLAVRPFRYGAAETPSICADDAAAAIRAMDPAVLAAMLADSFRFVPCTDEATSAGWPPTWSRGEFLEMVETWLLASSTAQVGFDWTPLRTSAWSSGGGERAWMECAQASIRFRETRAAPGAPAQTPGIERTAAMGSRMRLSLQRVSGEPWRITQWRELASGNGQSFAALLASARGLPAPRAGAGCLVSPAAGPSRERAPAGESLRPTRQRAGRSG